MGTQLPLHEKGHGSPHFLAHVHCVETAGWISGRTLDVYHTSTHGVALVQIWNAGLKCAACGSLKIQDAKKVAKNRHLGSIAQLCRAIPSQLRHVSTIGKKHVKQQYVLHMSTQYGELRPTSR